MQLDHRLISHASKGALGGLHCLSWGNAKQTWAPKAGRTHPLLLSLLPVASICLLSSLHFTLSRTTTTDQQQKALRAPSCPRTLSGPHTNTRSSSTITSGPPPPLPATHTTEPPDPPAVRRQSPTPHGTSQLPPVRARRLPPSVSFSLLEVPSSNTRGIFSFVLSGPPEPPSVLLLPGHHHHRVLLRPLLLSSTATTYPLRLGSGRERDAGTAHTPTCLPSPSAPLPWRASGSLLFLTVPCLGGHPGVVLRSTV